MDAAPVSPQPRGRDDVVFRRLDTEWVIFDPASNRLHALNLTAALVWDCLTGDQGLEDIAATVGGAFTPPRSAASILPDVERTVARFREQGLLR